MARRAHAEGLQPHRQLVPCGLQAPPPRLDSSLEASGEWLLVLIQGPILKIQAVVVVKDASQAVGRSRTVRSLGTHTKQKPYARKIWKSPRSVLPGLYGRRSESNSGSASQIRLWRLLFRAAGCHLTLSRKESQGSSCLETWSIGHRRGVCRFVDSTHKLHL